MHLQIPTMKMIRSLQLFAVLLPACAPREYVPKGRAESPLSPATLPPASTRSTSNTPPESADAASSVAPPVASVAEYFAASQRVSASQPWSFACALISSATSDPSAPVSSLAVRVTTATGLLTGTDRDVWLDIGPKSWRLDGSFPAGSTRVVTLPVDDVAETSSLTPGKVNLRLVDLRYIRFEKKGIALTDLPPLTPELIALQHIDAVKRIGGLTNAPDSIQDAITPNMFSPSEQIATARKGLATANLALSQGQAALASLQVELAKADKAIADATNLHDAAVHRAAELEVRATKAANDLQSIQNMLADEGFHFILQNVCHTEFKKRAGLCLLAPPLCLTALVVCASEKTVNAAWNALNDTLPGLQRDALTKAADLHAATVEAASQVAAMATQAAAKEALLVQLESVQVQLNAARDASTLAENTISQLEALVAQHTPDVDFPKPGQWVPQSAILIVNGSDYVRCSIGERLKRGNPSWIGTWLPL